MDGEYVNIVLLWCGSEAWCRVASQSPLPPPLPGQFILLRLLDWVLRGASQVMFVNNPLSGLIIFAGLILQNYWWALNGFMGTLFATISALILQQNRLERTHSKGVDMLPWTDATRVLSLSSEVPSLQVCMVTTASWWDCWWLCSPIRATGTGGSFCPTFSCPWCGERRPFDLLYRIVLRTQGSDKCIKATFFQSDSVQRPGVHKQPLGSAGVHAALQHPGVSPHGGHGSLQPLLPTSPHPASLRAGQHHLVGTGCSKGGCRTRPPAVVSPLCSVLVCNTLSCLCLPPTNTRTQLFMSIPVGIGQVYGCDNPWTGGIFIISLFISSPITCAHAVLGSAAGMVSGKRRSMREINARCAKLGAVSKAAVESLLFTRVEPEPLCRSGSGGAIWRHLLRSVGLQLCLGLHRHWRDVLRPHLAGASAGAHVRWVNTAVMNQGVIRRLTNCIRLPLQPFSVRTSALQSPILCPG